MSSPLRDISVFIASPGDLAPERKIFKDVIDQLNSGFGDGAGVRFLAIGWEDENAEAGRRIQSMLNEHIRKCDLFVLAMHRRWGQEAQGSPYSSYTEEEFHIALDLWNLKKSPEIIIFFKNVDSASISDPGPQLARVLAFKKQLEAKADTLYRSFNTEIDFGREIDKHLRDFARGDWKKLDEAALPIVFPQAVTGALDDADKVSTERLHKAEAQSQQANAEAATSRLNMQSAAADLSLVRASQKELALTRGALDAARNGRPEDAKILFAQATENTTDIAILSAAAEFYRQVGDIDNATSIVQRQVAISRDRNIAAEHYMKMVPPGNYEFLLEELLPKIMTQFPAEVQEEIQGVFEEVYGADGLNRMIQQMLVEFYSVEEIVQLAAFLASPVGQSSAQKQPKMMLAAMEYGQQEFARVLRERHPDWFETEPEITDTPVLEGTATAQSALPLPDDSSNQTQAR